MQRAYIILRSGLRAFALVANDTLSLTSIATLCSAILLVFSFPATTLLIFRAMLVVILYALAGYQLLLTILGLRARRRGLVDEYDTWIDTAFSTAVFFLLATVILLS